MVNALNVGNNILKRGFAENIDITPMKLQKLIYFVYRDYLKRTQRPLFNERFETWRYGPVIPSVYNEFKKYGSNAIRNYALEPGKTSFFTVNEESSPVFKEIIDNVWMQYKHYDGIVLSSMTHQEGTAWKKAYDARISYLSDTDIIQEGGSIGQRK